MPAGTVPWRPPGRPGPAPRPQPRDARRRRRRGASGRGRAPPRPAAAARRRRASSGSTVASAGRRRTSSAGRATALLGAGARLSLARGTGVAEAAGVSGAAGASVTAGGPEPGTSEPGTSELGGFGMAGVSGGPALCGPVLGDSGMPDLDVSVRGGSTGAVARATGGRVERTFRGARGGMLAGGSAGTGMVFASGREPPGLRRRRRGFGSGDRRSRRRPARELERRHLLDPSTLDGLRPPLGLGLSRLRLPRHPLVAVDEERRTLLVCRSQLLQRGLARDRDPLGRAVAEDPTGCELAHPRRPRKRSLFRRCGARGLDRAATRQPGRALHDLLRRSRRDDALGQAQPADPRRGGMPRKNPLPEQSEPARHLR